MTILVVTKITNYDLHGATVEAKAASGGVSPDAVQRLKVAHDEHHRTVALLREALEVAGLPYKEVSREESRTREYDQVITVGGDGTLLSASHQMTQGGRLFGLRSSESSVGYLCCAGPRDVDRLVKALQKGQYRTESAPRLVAAINPADGGGVIQSRPILNDFLYCNINPAATTRYRLRFREGSEVHRSSGIWIATGVGSTAAILAAGGQRRPAHDPLAQFKVRELYRLGHELPAIDGGFFDPDQDLFEIENRCPQGVLALDGQHGSLPLAYGDVITFRRAPPVELVRSLEV